MRSGEQLGQQPGGHQRAHGNEQPAGDPVDQGVVGLDPLKGIGEGVNLQGADHNRHPKADGVAQQQKNSLQSGTLVGSQHQR